MSKFTPGPWSISKLYTKGVNDGLAIHPCHFYFMGKIDESTEANARLIAVAPELYEACNTALNVFLSTSYETKGYKTLIREAFFEDAMNAIATLKNALAKVEGKE